MREELKNIERIEVKNAFPTPIAMTIIPEYHKKNIKLKKTILAREKKYGKPENYSSNIGGWHSDRTMTKWGGKQVNEIIDSAKNLANKMTALRNGKPQDFEWECNAWSNINRKGDSNEFHIHPGAFWSGVYYVDDGGCYENRDLHGEFIIMDPRGSGTAMYSPNLCFSGPGGNTVGATELLSPRNGVMLLFPSWLYHGVMNNTTDYPRISLSFNLIFDRI